MKKFLIKKPGQMMLLIILLMAAILIFTAAFFGRLTNYIHFGATTVAKEQAVNAAEAGIDYALWQLNQTAGSFNPSPTPTPLGTTGKFTVGVTNKSAILKSITSTGCVPDCVNPRAKRTIKVDAEVNSDIVVFNYGIQIGNGGLSLSGSGTTITGSSIPPVGNVYSNGNITGVGGPTITGDAWAVGTISSSPALNVNGARHPGASPASMPIADPLTWYLQWRTLAAAGGTVSSGCTLGGGTRNLGPKKYACDLTLNGGGDNTVDGPIWITGNLTLNGGAMLRINNSFGSTGTAIIVDGTISISGNSNIYSTNADPAGYLLIITSSTASPALSITGGTQSSVFYALDGTATISGGVTLTSIVAKQLDFSGNSTLIYDIGLASSSFSGGPGGSWQIRKGTYLFK